MTVTKNEIIEALRIPPNTHFFELMRTTLISRIEAEGIEGVNHFELDDEKWEAFQELLNRPVQHKPGLTKLLREPDVLSANSIDQLIAEISGLKTYTLGFPKDMCPNMQCSCCSKEMTMQEDVGSYGDYIETKDLKTILDKYRSKS